MIERSPTARTFNLLDPADCVALSRANAVRFDAEADAAADRGEFQFAADLRRAARRSQQEADLQERAALADQSASSERRP